VKKRSLLKGKLGISSYRQNCWDSEAVQLQAEQEEEALMLCACAMSSSSHHSSPRATL